MEQFLVFIGSNPILSGAFAVVLAALIATESARFIRKWKELDTQQAILLMNRQEPLILDASNSADFAKGHILGAVHMAPSTLEAGNKELMKSVDRPVLVYCKNGQVSPQMASRLTKMGFSEVYVLKGGLINWVADKQPVSRGKAVAKSDKNKQKKNKDKKKADKPAEAAAANQTKEASEEASPKASGDRSADAADRA
ncbi:MAG: rhodanese-like domain-containing protein [Pseudomonadota bacterium]